MSNEETKAPEIVRVRVTEVNTYEICGHTYSHSIEKDGGNHYVRYGKVTTDVAYCMFTGPINNLDTPIDIVIPEQPGRSIRFSGTENDWPVILDNAQGERLSKIPKDILQNLQQNYPLEEILKMTPQEMFKVYMEQMDLTDPGIEDSIWNTAIELSKIDNTV